MKNVINIGIIALLILVLGVYVRYSPVSDYKMEGTVLQVENGHALVSKRTDLTEDDLIKTSEEWLFEDYDLIYVGPLDDVYPGTKVRLVLSGKISSSYPARAHVGSYEVID